VICRLCQDSAKLCRSHVIPEFFYRPSYDEHSRACQWDRKSGQWQPLQKGHREKLLCESCEGQFAQYEGYVARVWYEQNAIPSLVFTDEVVISDLDYPQFKLFHLSLLWRASVSSIHMYAEIQLGPHQERIGQMLLNQDPGTPEDYGFLANVLVADDGHVVHGLLRQPRMSQQARLKTCQFVFGGCAWTYLIEGNPGKDWSRFFLAPDSDLVMPTWRFDTFCKRRLS